MVKRVSIIGKSGRVLKSVNKPTKLIPDSSFPKSLKSTGECHECGSTMKLHVGIKNGKPFHFFTCPKCKKMYHYR